MTAPVLVGPAPSIGGPARSPDWDDVLADIGDRIRAERRSRGWSQAELGQRSSLNLSAIKRLEAGKATLLSTFVMACGAFGADVWQLLSEDWRMPESGPSLTPRQAQVLREVAGGDSLSVVARRIGLERESVSAHLSQAYRRLGVTHLPRNERRAAALRVAMQHGLFDIPPNRTS